MSDPLVSMEARNALVTAHLTIAERVARQYSGRGVEYDDLFQVASLALVNAANRYDDSRGMRFSTFAIPTIVGEVKHYFRDRMRMIRVSRSSALLFTKIEKLRDEFYQQNQRMPRPAEIADKLNVTTENVLEAMESGGAGYPLSLNQHLSDDGDSKIEQMLGTLDVNFERIEYLDYLQRVIDELPDIERKIIRMRYYDERTQAKIAKELHVSQMYISRVERRILSRFRSAAKM